MLQETSACKGIIHNWKTFSCINYTIYHLLFRILIMILKKATKLGILTALLSIIVMPSYSQDLGFNKSTVYKVNKKVEIPVTLALFMSNFVGFQYLKNKPELKYDEIMALNADDIWRFDRVATKQNPDDQSRYSGYSDIMMNVTVALPLLLGFDREIRRDWLDLIILYGETHAVNTSIYMASTALVDRPRPFMYHPDVPYEDKSGTGTTVSFFSGHTSTTATASFFMAKVYSDYHPELGNKKFYLFGAALIPPVLVGFFRVKSMKHFPTDVIVGTAVGATIGIVMPQLHKNRKNKNLSFIPYTGAVNGLRIQYTLK